MDCQGFRNLLDRRFARRWNFVMGYSLYTVWHRGDRLEMNRKTIVMVALAVIALLGVGSPAALQDDVAAIESLVANMETAVLASDAELYLSYVDLSDANFAVEHTNWVNNWAEDDYLETFSLDVSDIEIDVDIALATLEMNWVTPLFPPPGETAVYPVEFHFDDETGQWLYGGEYWITTETEHFIIHTVPGLERVTERLTPKLPNIYDTVTANYGYVPERQMEIKIYDSQSALGATTLLDLPLISGWNEPAESLKITASERSSPEGVVAHEFTHFLGFEEAGQEHTRMPWWLSEGIADYMAGEFSDPSEGDETVLSLKAYVAQRSLVDWELLADFEETPVELWGFVYVQGYAFVRYITQTYGEDRRNEWLRLMATEMDIYEASEVVFDRTFDQLDRKFQSWLSEFRRG
jgi:hypothetical protein